MCFCLDINGDINFINEFVVHHHNVCAVTTLQYRMSTFMYTTARDLDCLGNVVLHNCPIHKEADDILR